MTSTQNRIPLKEIRIKGSSKSYIDLVNSGPAILPQKRIQLYSATEWEEFLEECTHSLSDKYCSVRRAGGAGDKGIDIAAFSTEDGFEGDWDNYQCKHYNHPLYPYEAYLELGKLCFYTYTEEFTIPKNYYFAAPQGIGTTLSKIIRSSKDTLRQRLIDNWDKYCKHKIRSKKVVLLEGEFKSYVENFDFNIVHDISVLELLNIHQNTPYYVTRFGTGLPSRPQNKKPPLDITSQEAIYIQKLLDAYAEYLDISDCNLSTVDNNSKLKEHLRKARIRFYCAESLHNFSRDYLVEGEFERLQEMIYDGIESIIISEHRNGFERVLKSVQESYKIQIDSHPLKERLEIWDRAGICHQLANNNRFSWANKDQK